MTRIIFHIFLALLATTANSQSASFFKTITTTNGLPSNYIFGTTEDEFGFLWAGTDKGLCRFNGSTWQVFNTDDGLPGNYINTVLKDAKIGGLFLGISEKGLYHFNTTTYKLQKVNTFTKESSIQLNNEKRIHLHTPLGDFNLNDKHVFQPSPPGINLEENSLTTINPNKNKLEIFYFNKNKPTAFFPTNVIEHYLPTIKLGVEVVNTQIPNTLINNSWIIRYNESNEQIIKHPFFTNKIATISVAKIGNLIYIAQVSGGLYSIDEKNNIKQYTAADGLLSNNINNLYADVDGNLIISTLGNGIQILPKKQQQKFTFTNGTISCITQSNNKPFILNNGSLFSIKNNAIQAISNGNKHALRCIINDNHVILGNFKGLAGYTISNNNLIPQYQIAQTSGISSIISWKNNSYLAATYGRGFMLIQNGKLLLHEHKKLPFNNIENILPINKNNIAALSYEDGFFILDSNLQVKQHYSKANGLPSNSVSYVLAHQNYLLVGTNKGLAFIKNNKVDKLLNTDNGFKGNTIPLIFKDSTNKIWVVSNKYIHVLQDNYLLALGSLLPNESKENAIEKAIFIEATQQLFISTKYQIIQVNINEAHPNNKVANAQLLSIAIDNKTVDNKSSFFEVPYNNQVLSFGFKPLANTIMQQQHIYYKLNNENWKVLSDSNILSLQALRTGNYKLFVKTINEDGYQSAVQKIAVFKVLQPWWLQWWFTSICIVAIAICIWFVTSFVNKRKYYQKLLIQKQLNDERNRISRDLHDNIGVYTTALLANIESIKQQDKELPQLSQIQTNAKEVMAALRETIWVLNKPEITIEELSDNFSMYCTKILANYHNIHFIKEDFIKSRVILKPLIAIQVLKIFQEAFQNSLKHAQANEIKFTSAVTANTLQLTLSDNGKGFDVQNKVTGYGLENMQWRANEANIVFELLSNKNGTKIILQISK